MPLVGCTVAPGFDFEDSRPAVERHRSLTRYPRATRSIIERSDVIPDPPPEE